MFDVYVLPIFVIIVSFIIGFSLGSNAGANKVLRTARVFFNHTDPKSGDNTYLTFEGFFYDQRTGE